MKIARIVLALGFLALAASLAYVVATTPIEMATTCTLKNVNSADGIGAMAFMSGVAALLLAVLPDFS